MRVSAHCRPHYCYNIDITMAWVWSSYNIAREEYLHRLKELNSK